MWRECGSELLWRKRHEDSLGALNFMDKIAPINRKNNLMLSDGVARPLNISRTSTYRQFVLPQYRVKSFDKK
jgi:hypothetical protein